MARYLLSVWGPLMSDEEQAEYMASGAFEATGKLNDRLMAEGKWVFAGGLAAFDTATVVSADANGDVVVTDGPYAEIKENLGGFWILDCADLDEALAIAQEATVACRGPIEVRPFDEYSQPDVA